MLKTTDEGVLIPVEVVPRARKSELDGVRGDALRVRLNAAPVDGAANKELCRLLASVLGVRKSAVEIVHGERGRSKTVLIRGVDVESIRTCLFE